MGVITAFCRLRQENLEMRSALGVHKTRLQGKQSKKEENEGFENDQDLLDTCVKLSKHFYIKSMFLCTAELHSR